MTHCVKPSAPLFGNCPKFLFLKKTLTYAKELGKKISSRNFFGSHNVVRCTPDNVFCTAPKENAQQLHRCQNLNLQHVLVYFELFKEKQIENVS